MLEVSLRRCCMCPNGGNSSSRVCPGVPGSVHETASPCRFVAAYCRDGERIVFVSKGFSAGKTFMSLYTNNGMGLHRVKSAALPERKTFDQAQEDLNAYAAGKHWRPCDA